MGLLSTEVPRLDNFAGSSRDNDATEKSEDIVKHVIVSIDDKDMLPEEEIQLI